MRFEMNRLPERSEEAILAEIRRVAALVNKPRLSRLDFSRHSRVGLRAVANRFGSFRAALERAGLGHLCHEARPLRLSPVSSREWSREEVLSELRRLASDLGKSSLHVADVQRSGRVGMGTIRARCGSWQSALRDAGLSVGAHSRRYADEECFENLLAVWTHLGRTPDYREMARPPSRVGGKAYVLRWGSWNKALAAFVAYANTEPAPSESPPPVAIPAKPRGRAAERAGVPLGLRYRVLARDRFRCVTCGRSPATDLSCALHVDHVVPFAKGGLTVAENLRSLCSDCNLGKGARSHHDETGARSDPG